MPALSVLITCLFFFPPLILSNKLSTLLLHGDFLPVNIDIVCILGQCPILTSLHIRKYLLTHLFHYLQITNRCFLFRKGILSQPFKDSNTVHGSKSTALTWQKLLKNRYSSSSRITVLRKKNVMTPHFFVIQHVFVAFYFIKPQTVFISSLPRLLPSAGWMLERVPLIQMDRETQKDITVTDQLVIRWAVSSLIGCNPYLVTCAGFYHVQSLILILCFCF